MIWAVYTYIWMVGKMRVVQTAIPDELHKRLVEVSKREGRPIKDIIRESIEYWLIWKGEMGGDPILKLKPVDFEVKTDAQRLKEILYGGSK